MRDSGCIRTIRSDLEGEVYRYEGEETEIFNQDTAFILTDMMQGVCREDYGTAAEYVSDQQYYAGKTGTTNDNQDIWFGGYSPYYTAVTWVGYDLPRESETLADEKYNIRIWSAFMDGLHTGLEKKAMRFRIPFFSITGPANIPSRITRRMSTTADPAAATMFPACCWTRLRKRLTGSGSKNSRKLLRKR